MVRVVVPKHDRVGLIHVDGITMKKNDAEHADAVREYAERWKRVNAFQAEEQRKLTIEQRMQQFFSLRALAKEMGWRTSSDAEILEVRGRWLRLYKAYGV
jgi:hypothetical protein